MINVSVIFDMDGVISDTQIIHSEVESALLRRYGINIAPEEITARYAGVNTVEYFRRLFMENGVEEDVEGVVKEKWWRMSEEAAKSVKPIPGSLAIIKELDRLNIRMAVGSASTLDYINTVLETLCIKDRFRAVASVEEVPRGKPDPAVFLLAAERMGAHYSHCVVVEDGFSGMKAAQSAQMKCIGVVPQEKRTGFHPVDMYIEDLTELYLIDILGLFSSTANTASA